MAGNFRERSPVLIGLLSILGIAAALTFAFSIDKIPALKQAYEIKAEFADAAGLKADNQVRVAGIKVGTVASLELAGDRVLVTMEIDNGTDIAQDASAEIKLATLLGTKFVEIDAAGGGPFLEDGDVIPLANTAIPYEIYQASNEGTAVLEDLDGPALNKMLEQLTKLTKVAQDDVGDALAGLNELATGLNEKRADIGALASGARELTGSLAAQGNDIVRLIDASNEVLGSLAGQREEIQVLLEATKQVAGELGGVLRDHRGEIDSILRKLHNALVVVDRNIEHVDAALKYSGRSSRYFAGVLQQGRWADLYTCALVLTIQCEQDE